MTVTIENVSKAVASADEHYAYAHSMRMLGNSKIARKHRQHAECIMREVYAVTKPEDVISNDELYAALFA